MPSYVNRDNRERLIKFILCSVLGLLIARMLHRPNSPTIAVSALLMLYIDRGYHGSLLYNLRRVQTQIIMGGIVVSTAIILRRILTAESWVICILSVVLALLVGFPLENRFHLAPLSVSLGNATLIVATGIVDNSNYYIERIIFCMIGAIMAYLINYILMPQHDRFLETLSEVRFYTHSLLSADKHEVKSSLMHAQSALPALIKSRDILTADARYARGEITEGKLAQLNHMLLLLQNLMRLLVAIEQHGEAVSADFWCSYEKEILAYQCHHRALLMHLPTTPLSQLTLSIRNQAEMHILHAMVEYRESLFGSTENSRLDSVACT